MSESKVKARPWWHRFHHMWSRDVGRDGYDKEEWKELERQLLAATEHSEVDATVEQAVIERIRSRVSELKHNLAEFEKRLPGAQEQEQQMKVFDTTSCQHENFGAQVNVQRLMDVGEFLAEVTVACTDCGTPFRFLGMPCGLLRAAPAVGVDGTEARLPIAPGPTPELPSRVMFEVHNKENVQ